MISTQLWHNATRITFSIVIICRYSSSVVTTIGPMEEIHPYRPQSSLLNLRDANRPLELSTVPFSSNSHSQIDRRTDRHSLTHPVSQSVRSGSISGSPRVSGSPSATATTRTRCCGLIAFWLMLIFFVSWPPSLYLYSYWCTISTTPANSISSNNNNNNFPNLLAMGATEMMVIVIIIEQRLQKNIPRRSRPW